MRETNVRHPSFLSKLALKLLEALVHGELMKMLSGTLHHQTGTRVADGRHLRNKESPSSASIFNLWLIHCVAAEMATKAKR